jgi:ArsR family transcriptional regulator
MSENPIIFDLQAKLCKAMGNSTRLQIINLLKEGPMCVTSIADKLRLTHSTTSRHLTSLCSAGVVLRERQAQEVIYSISSHKIVEVCELMRDVLKDHEMPMFEMFESQEGARK